MAQKELWNLGKQRKLVERSSMFLGEGDVVSERHALREEYVFSSWLDGYKERKIRAEEDQARAERERKRSKARREAEKRGMKKRWEEGVSGE